MSAEKSDVDVLREIDAWFQVRQEARPGWRESISRVILTLEAVVRRTIIDPEMGTLREELREARAELDVAAAVIQVTLGPDLAGRPFASLLAEVAVYLAGLGGGPLADCLADKARVVREALDVEVARALVDAHARELKAKDGRIDSLELRLQETEQKRLEAEEWAQRAWAELDALKGRRT